MRSNAPSPQSIDRQSIERPGADPLERARALGPTIEAAADEIERRRELPEPLVAALAEGGFFRLLLPRSLGGAELPPADYVPVHRGNRQGRRQHRLVPGPEFRLLDDRGLSRARGGARDFRRRRAASSPGGRPAGPRRGSVAGRLPGHRDAGALPAAASTRRWLGAHVPIVRARTATPRLDPDGSPVVRTMLFPKSQAEMTDIWHVDRPARHRQRQLYGRGSVRAARDIRCRAQRRSRARANRACSIPSAAAALCRRVSPGWRSASPAARSTRLSSWPATRSRAAPSAPCATTM